MNRQGGWEAFQQGQYINEALGLAIDYSCIDFPAGYLEEMKPIFQKAFQGMRELEHGAIANPDENRMVGHYWLRDAALAPDKKIGQEITDTVARIKAFARKIREGQLVSAQGKAFSRFLLIGIGGSALGPMLLHDAFGFQQAKDGLKGYFLDNTDPDGIARVLGELEDYLAETLVIVISKSGGTVETRNGMLETQQYFAARKIDFARQAVAITTAGSKMDRLAEEEGWLKRFYIWDWVGGRSSVTSAVGLLPLALQGLDLQEFLAGARECDQASRVSLIFENPAAILAAAWYYHVKKRKRGNMVVLPYRDSLQLMSRYLQQLIMESLGKEKDLENRTVHEGLTVFGNKGSTDQHAYVQQLLDGVYDALVVFVEIKKDQRKKPVFVEKDITSGDYLKAFMEGTRRALKQKKRCSLTISLEKLDPRKMGVLIALFERAVGLYAGLINVNAYHQPGVELGKKGASFYIELQHEVLRFLRFQAGRSFTVEEIAHEIGAVKEKELIYKILEYLYANMRHDIKKEKGETPFSARYSIKQK
ncbi:MAG: glucose-6-phosphate isomerase [Peptococcia bacterium]|jgi:glucose-6-phosphate isomerase